MKKLAILFIMAFMPYFAFAQEVPNAINYVGPNTGSSNTEGVRVNDIPAPVLSERYYQLEAQMKALKQSGNSDGSKFIELQKQMDAESKQSVTEKGKQYNGTLIQATNFEEFDAIGNTAVLTKSGMKGIATATEMRGTTAGKIWAVGGFQGAGTSANPDSLRVFYSVNGGATWVLYALASLGGTDKINVGEIDCEIIENVTGDKFLYVVYGLRQTGGTGKYFTGGMTLNITTFAGTLYAFAWPGDAATSRYYGPRITSDNSVWPAGAWIYVAISFDSGGVNTQKLVRCTSPYNTTPTWTYKADRIFWNQSGSTITRTLFTDIAFFSNGSDSIIVSFSGVPDSTKIFFSKMGIGGVSPTVAGQYAGFIGGSEPNNYKYGARLSSNGNNSGSVFCIFNQSGTTTGVKYFRTTNFGDFSTIAGQSVIWTATGGVSRPDIMGVRNANTHRFGFFFYGDWDSLQYVSVNSSGAFNSTSTKMNGGNGFTTGFYGPAVGMRFAANDSCFALYSATGPVNMWAASGCTGTVTSVGNTETPVSFSLSQNYPNPFNPVTKIAYALPKSGLVTLRVYDILGKEVATLVNEMKNAGSYSVDFSPSNFTSGVYFYKLETNGFSDIKKMMLIK
ncbi:MAG: T9SS type A sorting domain-containing protein [Ignavibacteriae bacterium]|nr:T9SS type A sorting domain-containing protein [Ignavibacteriota bacterium]